MQIILFQTAFNIQQPLLAGTGMGLDTGKSVCRKKALFSHSPVHSCPKVCSQMPLSGGSAGREPACNAGGRGLIPGLGRSPGKGKGYPLQYSGLRIPWTK